MSEFEKQKRMQELIETLYPSNTNTTDSGSRFAHSTRSNAPSNPDEGNNSSVNMSEMEKERLIKELMGTLYASNTNTNGYPRESSTRSNSNKSILATSIQRTLRALDRQISSFLTPHSIFTSNNSDEFLESIDDLIATINSIDSIEDNQSLVNQSDDLLQKCMNQLDHEFRNLMQEYLHDSNSDQTNIDNNFDEADNIEKLVAVPVSDYDVIVDLLPPGCIFNLNKIAKRMVSAGFGHECIELYIRSRHDFITESVERLGFSTLISQEINSITWDKLELEIARWVPVFNTVFRILIPSERSLCDRLFEGLGPFGDMAFAGVSREMALQLVSFAYSITSTSRAPHCLYRILDMYECTRDILPEIDTIFCDEYSAQIYTEVEMLCSTIRNSIRGIFMEFENLIRHDPLGNPVPGGRVHPVTRYVMNYLKTACGWRQTLEEVIRNAGSGAGSDTAVDPDRPSSSLGVNFAWIMDNLQKNMEAKSKVYGEPGLAFFFLVNNGRYIVNKVKGSELRVILGTDWVKQMDSKISRSIKSYLNTWTKITAKLVINDGAVQREKIVEFNRNIEENFRVQSGWIMVDDQIMSELRASVVEIVGPVYRMFLARVGGIGPRNRDMFIKFTPEELEARIGSLFRVIEKR